MICWLLECILMNQNIYLYNLVTSKDKIQGKLIIDHWYLMLTSTWFSHRTDNGQLY